MALTAAQITTAYQNVLQRNPSTAEVNAWVNVSNSGALTDAQIYAAIVNSPEAQNYTAATIRIYQAAFGRVPDKAGLDVNTDVLSGGAPVNALAGAFVMSQEFANKYNGGVLVTDNAAAVTDAFLQSLYVNVLGRVGSAAEIQAWKNAVATPGSGYTKASDVLVGFSQSAEFVVKTGPAIQTFLTAAAQGTAVYTGPLFDPSVGTGINVNLTTGTDTPASTSGNDVYTAGALAPDGVTAADTLTALDTINGGAGVDTLVLDTTGNKNQAIVGTITNVENVTFVGSGAAIAALDASAFSGQVKFQQTADTTLTVNNLTGQTVALDRVADTTTVTANYSASATASTVTATGLVGDATYNAAGTGLKSATINIDKTATGKSLTFADTGNTTTGVTINASGASTITANTTALATVVVKGAGAVNLTTGTAATTSVDASGSTGGLTLVTALATGASFTGGTGKDTVTAGATTKAINMGAGDDTVNLSVAALGAGGTIEGGDGTDTISLSAANAATASASTTLAAAISGFEKFGVGVTGAATVINADNIDGMTTIVSAGTAGGANTLTVNNLAGGSTFELTGSNAIGTTLNLKDASGTSDVLNLRFAATDGFASAGTITAAGVETLNITTADTDTTAPTTVFTAPITATSVKSVTVSGNVGIDLTGLTATTLTTLDASGVTATGAVGAVTITTGALANAATLTGGAGNDSINAAAATKSVTLTGNAGNDALTGSSTKASTITGGAGNDTLTGGAEADTISGGDGNDTINSGAGLDVVDVGTGTDIFQVTANANGNVYASITGMGKGDQIDFVAGGGAATFTQTKISLAPTAAFADFLQAAAAGGADRVVWFQYNGDTYLVQDVTAGATFNNGQDQVVKLVGLVDLSTSTIDGAATNILTI